MHLQPFGACPSPRQMAWYRRRTAFVHFGINTFYGTEWGDGTENPARFNPKTVDCRQWARELKAAGFDTAILTAKHHDGFCLWPTATTDHSVKSSPYQAGQGDVVRAFTDACREFGLKPGIYLSPWDRHEPCWGTDAYNEFYLQQLTELLSNYGPIYECWWDGAGSEAAHYDWERWAQTVRRLQPECVIFGSLGASEYVDIRWVGNEAGYAGDPCWSTVDIRSLLVENPAQLNSGTPDGERFIPAECDTSIRPGWFYHPEQDAQVKSPGMLVQYWFASAGRNAGILLNVPPDTTGRINKADIACLREWNRRLQALFAKDLTRGCAVTASSATLPPEHLLVSEEDAFYIPAPQDPAPAVTFTLRRPTAIGCFVLEEAIEYGHRVRRFAVDALVDGQWVTVAEKACVGYRRAVYFPPVTATAVCLRLTDCAAIPILRRFSLHGDVFPYLEDVAPIADPLRDLAAAPGARVLPGTDGVSVELGGIFPYNTVVFEGEGPYVLEAFNGTTYQSVAHGTADGLTTVTFPLQDASYRLRIRMDGTVGTAVHVYCR